MNILFQNDYFPEEQAIWEKYGAKVIHGLCPEKVIKEFSPVVARGTIAFDRSVKQSLKYNGWPNIMWPFNNDWKVYNYDYLMNFNDLLNDDAEIIIDTEWSNDPIDDVWSAITHSEGKKLWVRSNSGSKQFSGGVFTEEEFLKERDYLKQKGINLDFVIASPKKIYKEWRCVIINHEVISSSQYMKNCEPETKSYTETPEGVIKFANYWAKKHMFMFPDSYVLDVCDVGKLVGGYYEDDYRVCEVNSLLSSGWYECDIERIVDIIVNQLEQIG
jgi:hypothetical protein